MAYIMGTDEPETLTGTERGDAILGFAGDDRLIGLGGSDQLFGHGGADLLEGGLGDDIYQLFEDTTDTVIETGGWDMIRTDIGRDLEDFPEIEALHGLISYGGRPLKGNALDNEIVDANGGNLLDGREGDDYLNGEAGNDVLVGGLGTDFLIGGRGNDRFDFLSAAEIGLAGGTRDVIHDFEHFKDKLNLGLIDANSIHTGNQAFSFVGDAAFSGTAGELRAFHDTLADGTTLVTIVAGDTDGDGVADFEIELRGTLSITTTDFIL